MPYTTLVSGTVITASWANASVRDQVVTPFATAAARTSAITTPIEGMLSYRTDAKYFEGYDGVGWSPVHMRAQAFKLTNKLVNNSTVLTSDTELTWPVRANAVYSFELHLRYESNTTSDAKIGWSYPVGTLMAWNLIANDAALIATITGDYTQTATPALGGNVVTTCAHATGMVTTASTAGTLALQFAQNTASVYDTLLSIYSYGFLTRVL